LLAEAGKLTPFNTVAAAAVTKQLTGRARPPEAIAPRGAGAPPFVENSLSA
jgi:hypothetical protein